MRACPGCEHVKNKTRSLAKISRQARKLFQNGVFPKALFGNQASGVSPAAVVKNERDAANTTGIAAGRCRYATLCVAFGTKHPTVRLYSEAFTAWFRYLLRMGTSIYAVPYKDLAIAFDQAKNRIKNSMVLSRTAAANQVQGLMSWVIFLLLRYGWDPVNLKEWKDPRGDVWRFNFTTPTPLNLIVKEFLKDFHLNEAA